MSQVAEAFVRIRPDTRGFQQEAEGGVRSAFGNLARIAASAFAIKEGFDFGKDLVTHAGDVQKQLEAVKNEFGAASEEVLKFGENAAGSFAISEHAAATASARFGIIFRNLGIGVDQAADMTVGFEKLAGSLSLIRNVDPSVTLKNIPLAIQGNLRSLKQLGIATDQTQLKLAAFKLGITQSVTQALTPATRAQAIYAIATARLPEILKQAAAGTTDFATRSRILSAILDNAKDRLGAGLLPAMTTLVNFATDVLPGALRITGEAFRALADTVSDFADFVKPIFEPLIDEIGRLRTAAGGDVLGQLKKDFLDLSPIAKIAVGAVAALGLAFASTVAAAAPISFTIIGIAALAVAFREAYDRSSRFRDVVQHIGDVIKSDVLPPIEGIGEAINRSLGSAFSFVQDHLHVFTILGGALAGAAAGMVALRVATAAYAVVAKTAAAITAIFDAELLANPIGLAVVAIAALVGGLIALYTQSATFRRIVNEAFADAKRVAADLLPVLENVGKTLIAAGQAVAGFFVGTIIPAAEKVAHYLAPIFEDVAKTIETAFRDAEQIIKAFVNVARAAFGPLATAIVGPIRAGIAIVEALWKQFGGTITTVVKNSFGGLAGVIRAALQIVRGVIDVFTGLLTGDWRKVWDGLKEIVSGGLNGVKAIVKTEAENIEAIFSGMWQAIEKFFLTGIEKIVGLLAKIPNVSAHIPHVGTVGFTNPFKGIDEDLKSTIDGIGKTSKDAGTKIPNIIGDAIKEAQAKVDAITAAAGKSASSAVADVVGQGADSADAAKISQRAADAVGAQITAVQTQIDKAVKVQDAGIAKAKTKLGDLGKNLAQAIAQEAQDVHDAVEQAKQNLTSIGSSLSDAVGKILDEPIRKQQQSLSAAANRKTLDDLRRSVLLPGGKNLSADPDKALAQLRSLAGRASTVSKSAINDFILQYQGALLAVKQDQTNVLKENTMKGIDDLTDAFNRHKISLTQFKKGILAELTKDHVSYKDAGALLGTAFANGFRDTVKGLFKQAVAINVVPANRRDGITGSEPSLVQPLKTLQKDQQAIGKIHTQIGRTQVDLLRRVAKASEKTAALNAQLAGLKLGVTSSDKNPGKQGKNSAALTGTIH